MAHGCIDFSKGCLCADCIWARRENLLGKNKVTTQTPQSTEMSVYGKPIQIVQTAGAPVTQYSGAFLNAESHTHTGKIPIKIGGFDVHLGKAYQIDKELLEQVDLICALNGQVPRARNFGQFLPLVECELPDRGGVPVNWLAWIESVAEFIRAGKKVLGYCTGSHGRTGVFAASLLAVMEPDVADPVAAIRERHCEKAVESKAQIEAVFAIKGVPVPEKYIEEFKPKAFGGYTSGQYWDNKTQGWKAKPVRTRPSWVAQEAIHYYNTDTWEICDMALPMGNRYVVVARYEGDLAIDPTGKHAPEAAAVVTDPKEQAGKAVVVSGAPSSGTSTKDHPGWCVCEPCLDECIYDKAHINTSNDAVSTYCTCRDCTIAWKNELKSEETVDVKNPGHNSWCICHDCLLYHAYLEEAAPHSHNPTMASLLDDTDDVINHDPNCQCVACKAYNIHAQEMEAKRLQLVTFG